MNAADIEYTPHDVEAIRADADIGLVGSFQGEHDLMYPEPSHMQPVDSAPPLPADVRGFDEDMQQAHFQPFDQFQQLNSQQQRNFALEPDQMAYGYGDARLQEFVASGQAPRDIDVGLTIREMDETEGGGVPPERFLEDVHAQQHAIDVFGPSDEQRGFHEYRHGGFDGPLDAIDPHAAAGVGTFSEDERLREDTSSIDSDIRPRSASRCTWASWRRGVENCRWRCLRRFRRSGSVQQEKAPVEEEQEEEGVYQETGLVPRALACYSKAVVARCPCCCFLIGLIVVLVVGGGGLVAMPPEPNMDFGSFMKTDINVSVMRDAFVAAKAGRQDGSGSRRLQGAKLYKSYDLVLAYELAEGATARSLQDVEVLVEIARFERMLRELPGWKALCNQSEVIDRFFCESGISYVNYALPSLTMDQGKVVPSRLAFDAGGRDLVPLETSERLMQAGDVNDVIFPSGFNLGSENMLYVRSVFRFKLYCCTTFDSNAVKKKFLSETNEVVQKMVEDTLYPIMNKASKGVVDGWDPDIQGHGWPLRVFYAGMGMEDLLAMEVLFGDMNLAGGSVAFVLFYLLFHTKSIILGTLGLMVIIMSVPVSFVVLTLLTGSRSVQLANFLSVFLIVGLGSDVVFVYTDFWRDSKNVRKTTHARAAWTLLHAGKASLATSATTAVSFLANLASVLKPLREFGFFMGMCVMMVWLIVTMLYVPLCIVDERWCSKLTLCSRDGQDLRKTNPRMARLMGRDKTTRFVHWVGRHRRKILVISVLITIASLLGAGVKLQVDTGVPNVYPKDHNLNEGKKVLGYFPDLGQVFDAIFPAPANSAMVCNETDFETSSSNCPIYWCEAHLRPDIKPDEKANKCYCHSYGGDAERVGCSTSMVFQRWVGSPSTDAGKALSDADIARIQDYTNATRGDVRYHSNPEVLAPLLLQEWETGKVKLQPLTEVIFSTAGNLGPQSPCIVHELCYCGSFSCKAPSKLWATTAGPSLSMHSDEGRRLQAALPSDVPQWKFKRNQRTWVQVLFGIEVLAEPKLLGEMDPDSMWGFNPRHDMRHHWSQRNIMSFCTDLAANLRVTERKCWIEDFRDYVVDVRSERFPLAFPELFDALIVDFANSGLVGLISAKDYFWFRDGQTKASYMSFLIDVSSTSNAATAMEAQKNWDDYIDKWNLNAQTSAKGAWQTSGLWVQAQAQAMLISSTIETLCIVLFLALIGMLVFTRNLLLSMMVVVATTSVICGLAFFIVVIMSWAIGPIEVIALIVFIGYAVTYSLHVAHRYGGRDAVPEDANLEEMDKNEVRILRTVSSLKSIGGAALGSAATTMGCAIFLLFCTLTIFQKLGGVVLAVTVMSIVVALVPLPAALLWAGPRSPGGTCRSIASSFMTSAHDKAEKYRNALDSFASKMDEQRNVTAKPTSESSEPSVGTGQIPSSPVLTGASEVFVSRGVSNLISQTASSVRRSPVATAASAPSFAGAPIVGSTSSSFGAGPSTAHLPSVQGTPPMSSPAPRPLLAASPLSVTSAATMGSPGPRSPGGVGAAQPQPWLPLGGRGASPGVASTYTSPAICESDADTRRRLRLNDMDFEIGTESPLERIWARSAEVNSVSRAPTTVQTASTDRFRGPPSAANLQPRAL